MNAQFWRSGWDRKTRNLAAGKLRRKKAWLEVPKVETHTDQRWIKPVERLRRAMLRCICDHSDTMLCGAHYEWCSRCGCVRRIGAKGTPLMEWQWPTRRNQSGMVGSTGINRYAPRHDCKTSLPTVTFSEQLKTHRERLGLTQAELAALLDVPARTHWEWESGNTTPHAITQEGALARLSKAKRRSQGTNAELRDRHESATPNPNKPS